MSSIVEMNMMPLIRAQGHQNKTFVVRREMERFGGAIIESLAVAADIATKVRSSGIRLSSINNPLGECS